MKNFFKKGAKLQYFVLTCTKQNNQIFKNWVVVQVTISQIGTQLWTLRCLL